jgi:hypothetical protein
MAAFAMPLFYPPQIDITSQVIVGPSLPAYHSVWKDDPH